MALTYSNFNAYPLQIVGINSDYNPKITAVENFVKSDMGAVGVNVTDAILSCFVFWFFCQDKTTTVTPENGEMSQVAEFSQPEIFKQIQAWNYGVDQLRVLCGITKEEIETIKNSYLGYYPEFEIIDSILSSGSITINTKYLSKRSAL
jgi:hypothetical protein